MRNSGFAGCAVLAASLCALCGCEEKKPAPGAGSPTPRIASPAGNPANAAGHGGAIIQLGAATIGPFAVSATRDEGQIVAGKDAPIDVTVTPTAGSTVKATAVRFWVGSEDAAGSVKARAAIENPAEPNRWHTHAEVPDPMPSGSRLWVEIEDDAGGKSVGSFELRV